MIFRLFRSTRSTRHLVCVSTYTRDGGQERVRVAVVLSATRVSETFGPGDRRSSIGGPFRATFNLPVDVSAPFPDRSPMQSPLDTVFSALADPTRRAILTMLLEDDMAVTDVAAPFEMSLAAISKHLQVLADARLISQEKRGRLKWCRLEPDALREASVWMQAFGMMEGVDLDAFERFLAVELSDPPDDPRPAEEG